MISFDERSYYIYVQIRIHVDEAEHYKPVPNEIPRPERRSWHGNSKISDSLTAAELINIDKFENSSPTDTSSSGERKIKS